MWRASLVEPARHEGHLHPMSWGECALHAWGSGEQCGGVTKPPGRMYRVQGASCPVGRLPACSPGVRGKARDRRSVGRRGSSDHSDGTRLWTLGAGLDLELDPLTLVESAEAVHSDRRVVDEHVRATVDRDEAVTLLRVEPLDGALSHTFTPGAGLLN